MVRSPAQVARLDETRKRLEEPDTILEMIAGSCLRPDVTYIDVSGMAADQGDGRSHADRTKTPDWEQPQREYGANSYPGWLPDGDHVLYQSEIHGVENLKVVSLGSGKRYWVTKFTEGRVRSPRVSWDGRRAVFERGDGIYVVDLPETWPGTAGEPRRVRIEIPLDERQPIVERVRVTSGASEMELSPDGKQIAFVHHGEIFAMKASKEEPFASQVTRSPARDHDITWTKDSEGILFVSDRDGDFDLYEVRSDDEDEPRLSRTLQYTVKQLTKESEDVSSPRVSPDGERIAYVRGRGDLVVMKADGSDAKVLVEGWASLQYSWSPDSKWIAYSRDDENFNSDIFILAADGSGDAHNVTRHPDDEWAPSWSADGKVLAFVGTRGYASQSDVYFVRLTQEDEDLAEIDRLDRIHGGDDAGGSGRGDGDSKGKGKKGDDGDDGEDEDEDEEDTVTVEIDFEGIHERIHRLTRTPGREDMVLINEDATEFFFRSNTDGETDLWKIGWDGDDLERVTKGGTNPRNLHWDADQKKLYYRTSSGSFAAITPKGDKTAFRYQAESSIDRFEQRRAVMREAWRELAENFYDPEYHGVDWAAAYEAYRPFAEQASTFADFHDALKMMIGELAASHLNVWGGPGDAAAEMVPGPEAEWASPFGWMGADAGR